MKGKLLIKVLTSWKKLFAPTVRLEIIINLIHMLCRSLSLHLAWLRLWRRKSWLCLHRGKVEAYSLRERTNSSSYTSSRMKRKMHLWETSIDWMINLWVTQKKCNLWSDRSIWEFLGREMRVSYWECSNQWSAIEKAIFEAAIIMISNKIIPKFIIKVMYTEHYTVLTCLCFEKDIRKHLPLFIAEILYAIISTLVLAVAISVLLSNSRSDFL